MPYYIHGKTINDIKKALKKSTVSKELKDEILQLLPRSTDSVDWLKFLQRQLQQQQRQLQQLLHKPSAP
jgi:DNA-binding transcriptional MerR regulator